MKRLDLVADLLAEHWFVKGGCCCGKQGRDEFTYHVAGLIMKAMHRQVTEDWHGKATGGGG